jgi:hypothetical protein
MVVVVWLLVVKKALPGWKLSQEEEKKNSGFKLSSSYIHEIVRILWSLLPTNLHLKNYSIDRSFLLEKSNHSCMIV